MKEYKGFIIENGSFTHEEKEWTGGHSSEGTGRYITTSYVKVLNLKTKTVTHFSSESEAIDAIDNCGLNKKFNAKAESVSSRLKAKRDKIQEKVRLLREEAAKVDQQLSLIYSEKKKIP